MHKSTGSGIKNKKLADVTQLAQLNVLQQIISLINKNHSVALSVTRICELIPKAYPYPGGIYIRLKYSDNIYQTGNFRETPWLKRQIIISPDDTKAEMEIFFSAEYIDNAENNLSSNDTAFLENITTLISGLIYKDRYDTLTYDNRERLKELKSINRTAEILKKDMTMDKALQEICSFLPEAWQYPEQTVARIAFENQIFVSKKFKETPWVQQQIFETPDNKRGSIEVFYLKKFPQEYEGPFLKEERSLIDNLAALISGTASRRGLQDLLLQNTERLKELKGINETSKILKQTKSLEESLEIICSILPEAWQYPEYTVARIIYEDKIFKSTGFKETHWFQKQEFEAPGNKSGLIEIFYLKEFPEIDEGPFMKEERNLLLNLAHLIAGSATKEVLNTLLFENRERLKELRAINQTSEIIAEGKPIDETLQSICSILPDSWQFPENTVARINFQGKIYTSKDFRETPWVQKENFITIDNKKGCIEIYYLKKHPEIFEGPFLKEERDLIINIGKLISGYLNNYKGREIYRKNILAPKSPNKSDEYRQSLIRNKRPLQLYFNKQILDKYIYLDMMKYKVKEILFVATLYDAFILENEDSFFEQFMGEIYQYSLFSLPRITAVTDSEEAIHLLATTNFDLIILMVGIDRDAPINLSKKLKQKQPHIPLYLLLNEKSNIKYYEELVPTIDSVDKIFAWNGNSQIFFAIVKSIEDKANVDNDTSVGLVRVILLVEDSVQYYSRYLQMLYSIVFGQVQQLLPEFEKNELDKICKMRSRPKILLARNYEDAVYIFNKYKDFLLCVISDVEFERNGIADKEAGIRFISYAKSQILNLPIILQSSEPSNEQIARVLEVKYLNKNSDTLINDLKSFLNYYLGFGDFIFRDKTGKQIAVARSFKEFENLLKEVPEESIALHASENQFSLWLMARGEIHLAKILNPMRLSDFDSLKQARQFFIDTIKKYKDEKLKGKILSFEESYKLDEKNIVTFSSGSLGGKGRGLAFINTLINNLDVTPITKEINIRAPKTVIIGTDEFDSFIRDNLLYEVLRQTDIAFHELKQQFIQGKLSDALTRKLQLFVEQIHRPIAVRSSSLSEDSINQPFAGVFDTYIIPCDAENKDLALLRLKEAIKLVFASTYSDDAKNYFKAIHHKWEDEKMAVILQELVGNRYENYYYPHISGVAQSYNFYPVAHMQPEEGFAVTAIGLGSYVVDGWNAYRFSPRYPNIDMFTTKDLISSTQTKFYAVDCCRQHIDFIKDGELAALTLLDISEAEKHGTLNHCASTYNAQNDKIETGTNTAGPRIINFADILKYNYIPLASTIQSMLTTIEEALGSPVEIEFALDLEQTNNKLPSFYLLQIKPLLSSKLTVSVNPDEMDKSSMVLYTKSSLGNGVIKNIRDVIYVETDTFNKMKTMQMVEEIRRLNETMSESETPYVLIGPGRWGTRDPFLGIPVNWSQISNAKIIVEISLANYPLDSSLGSHFFHNVTSLNIGYFSILDSSSSDFIRWEKLRKQNLIHKTEYFRHVRFEKPLTIVMNGKQKTSVIIDNS